MAARVAAGQCARAQPGEKFKPNELGDMKHGSNSRRGRPRGGNGRRFQPAKNHNFESSGPEVKIRGTAQQVLDKYLALARDAASSGDRISAENYLQHAEHYYRIINAEYANRPQNGGHGRPPMGPAVQGGDGQEGHFDERSQPVVSADPQGPDTHAADPHREGPAAPGSEPYPT